MKRSPNPPSKTTFLGAGLADGLAALIAWLAGGSAAFVAAIGQFALAAVLALVAFGIVLRLVRRKRLARRRTE